MDLDLKLNLSDKQKFFLDYAVKGLIGSIIAFVLLYNTKILIFSFFPLLVAIGLAAKIYTARIKSYERNLFVFLDDLKDLLQGGMNIVTAVEISTTHDYGALNEKIRRLAAQVKIGVSFDKALSDIFGEIDSPIYKQVIQIISETTKIGGSIIKIFSSISSYVRTLNDMVDQRKSKTFSTVFSSYFMFFVFIAIILIIQIIFLPMLSGEGVSMSGEGASQVNALADVDFNSYFLYLILIQGFFAGPIIGKISEGNAIAGVKHSIILISVSVPIYVLVSLLFIG
ncbi:type II secretion system F family protein [archaeon]|nr:type II secretion system F family protein [archaeon]MDD2477823.1 type II secretion system F family protein [Candidatus ainarchaeum sp.]MDD3084665.1 type II secretion system F family protein [Candidatus ainarchaeum sp.]MDD4662718.1 type II secretion system F family protein [Candidatus ainarchaeum sp.]